jgi:hypothetical protein
MSMVMGLESVRAQKRDRDRALPARMAKLLRVHKLPRRPRDKFMIRTFRGLPQLDPLLVNFVVVEKAKCGQKPGSGHTSTRE